MAASHFTDAVCYALTQLGMSHITLKEEQLKSIDAVYRGKDVFMSLPTGFGRSVCFQALPFVFDHKSGIAAGGHKISSVIVVSPLIALMVDQVKTLRVKGVKAVIISSAEGIPEAFTASESTLCTASIIFSSPEALLLSRWRESLDRPDVVDHVCAVVVDEAHCVSKWSKDFRRAFSRVAELRALVPSGTPFMACTATASRSVKKEVIESLEMSGCVEVSASLDRPNIYYVAVSRTNIEADFLPLVTTLRDKAVCAPRVLVYCQTLDMCADLYAHFLFELGCSSYNPPDSPQLSDNRLFGMFHAHTPQYNKDVILKSLCVPDGVVRVVFATVALGMGIDLKDVNCVIHYGAPHCLEDYYQESGRGGRSEAFATSTVYWKPADCPVRKQPVTLRDHEHIAVRRFLQNVTACRRKWLLDHFDVKYNAKASRCCDNCSNRDDTTVSSD